jgi:Zn-dependent protease
VPVNFGRLRHPKSDMLWVAAAGPGSNLAMALLWALAIKISSLLPTYAGVPLALMGAAGIMINVVLMVLNLLPLPPLDGGRIAVSLLPHPYAQRFAQVERYGFLILLVLLFTGILGKIIWPFIILMIELISWLFY